MRLILALALTLLTVTTQAALKPAQSQYLEQLGAFVNPGFEEGFNGWTDTGTCTKSTEVAVPYLNRSLKFACTAQSFSATQTVTNLTAFAGMPYVAACKVKATNIGDITIKTQKDGIDEKTTTNATANTWENIIFRGVIGATSNAVSVVGSSITSTVHIDDCSLKIDNTIPVGLDGEFLTYDSTEPSGLKANSAISGTLNPVTDWATGTCTSSWSTNTTVTCKYRRVGDTAEVQARVYMNGAADAVNLSISLPDSLAIDSTKMEGGQLTPIGTGVILDSGVAFYTAKPMYSSSNLNNVFIYSAKTWAGTNPVNLNEGYVVNNTDPMIPAVNDFIEVSYRVPIQGWSSGVDAAITQTTIEEYNTTEWADYTTTWGATTTNPILGNGALEAKYRRDGDTLHGHITLKIGSTTTLGSGDWYWTLPSGLSIDTAKLVGRAFNRIGSGTIHDVGNVVVPSYVDYYTPTAIRLLAHIDYAAGINPISSGVVSGTVPMAWVSNDELNLKFSVPIQGWTDTTTKPAVIAGTFENINSTDLIKVKYDRTTAQSMTNAAYTGIIYNNSIEDNSAGAYNSSTGVFTASRAGSYMLCGYFLLDNSSWSVGELIEFRLNHNAGAKVLHRDEVQSATTSYKLGGGCAEINMAVNDTADFQLYHNQGAAVNIPASLQSYTYMSITELPDYEAIVKNLGDLKITNTVNDYSHFLEASNTFGSVLQLSNDGSTAADGYIYKDASDDLVIRNETSTGDVRLSTNGGQLTGNDGVTTGNIQFDCTIEVAASASARFLEQLCSGGRHAMSAGFSCGGNSAVTIGPCSSLGAGAICTDTSKSRWGLDCGATVTNPRLYVTCCKGGR